MRTYLRRLLDYQRNALVVIVIKIFTKKNEKNKLIRNESTIKIIKKRGGENGLEPSIPKEC